LREFTALGVTDFMLDCGVADLMPLE
jgi:hypothetical protein